MTESEVYFNMIVVVLVALVKCAQLHYNTQKWTNCHHRIITNPKTDMRSSLDSTQGLLNSSQMLLLSEPLELWHWSRG